MEDRGEIAGPLDRRTAGRADGNAHLRGEDVRQRGLAQAGGAVEEVVVERIVALPGRLDSDTQNFFDPILAGKVDDALRPQRALRLDLIVIMGGHANDPLIWRHARYYTGTDVLGYAPWALGECRADDRAQLATVEWLLQNRGHAERGGPGAELGAGLAGHQHYRTRRPLGAEMLQDLESASASQGEVQQHAAESLAGAADAPKRLSDIAGELDVEVWPPKDARCERADA